MDYDIAVVGAGPAGLCFAACLAEADLRVVLIDAQPEDKLADAADDGREIAITHHSQAQLARLGIWPHIPDEAIGNLGSAKVLDGNRGPKLLFDKPSQLGWMVSNYAIRRAAYARVDELPNVTLLSEHKVEKVEVGAHEAALSLTTPDASSLSLTAKLLIAADSRFSGTRRQLGIATHMHDFGATMMVVRVRSDLPHDSTAWEWFGYGQTLALLPLHDVHTASLVLTLPPAEMRELGPLSWEVLSQVLTERFQHRLGRMQVIKGPHCYPLVGTYAHRFYGQRCALIGDAAVGMHPVTAHGFNLGLMSATTLAEQITRALSEGENIASPSVLSRYQRRHRIASWPLYAATQAMASLYTDDRKPAMLLRKAGLASARVLPVQRVVNTGLTRPESGLPTPLARLWQRAN